MTSVRSVGMFVDIDNNSVDIDSQGDRAVACAVMVDHVDGVVATWRNTYPDWDLSGMELLGRVARIERLLDVRRLDVLRPHGLTTGDIDVLASLWRHPGGQRPRDLRRTMMIGSGTLTPRLDRLEISRMAGAPARPRGSSRLRAGAHRCRTAAGSTARRAAARRRESGAHGAASSSGGTTCQRSRPAALNTRRRREPGERARIGV